jgi:hypothetical protein
MHSINSQQKKPEESDRARRAERRADLLVRMLQGTMGLEGQALPPAVLQRLREQAIAQLLNR